MTGKDILGPSGLTLAVAASLAMCATAHFASPVAPLTGNVGLCLPSPNLWPIPNTAAWIVNVVLICAIATALYFLNRAYSFVPSQDTILPAMFLMVTSSNPWIAGSISSSVIFAALCTACIAILFSCFKQNHAPQELFAVATLLSLGSMVQYAFIFMIPAFIIIAVMMKCFKLKELCAFILGLIAPYWVGIGLGIIPLGNFRLPTFTNLFDGFATKEDLLVGMVLIAASAILLLILALYNGMKLYAGNSQRRIYNNAFNVLAFFCAACMVINFNNMLAYLSTIYLALAIQIADLFALWNIPRPRLWLTAISLLYIGGFTLMML